MSRILKKVLKSFPYAHDQINVRTLVPGECMSFPASIVPGLVSAGFLGDADEQSASAPENKAHDAAPESGAPVETPAATDLAPTGQASLAAPTILAGASTASPGEPEVTPVDNHKFAGTTIIEAWQHLDWPSLRTLGSSLSDTQVTTKADAVAAVEAELKRREAFAKK